jgi:RNA polymerase sigma-70 factor (ECF subfamily)
MYEIDDQIIVTRVLAGDRNAFGMLVAKYQAPIYNLMCRAVPSVEDAAELAQEVFLKAFSRIRTYRPGRRKFFSWLYAIGVNTARDHLRRLKRQGSREGIDPEADLRRGSQGAIVPNPEAHWVALQSLRQGLSRIALNQREALILKYRYELTHQEIAEVFDVSESAIKMRIQRGLAQLRTLMENEEHHEYKN